jgi:membrane-associated phospholipid phosphatase
MSPDRWVIFACGCAPVAVYLALIVRQFKGALRAKALTTFLTGMTFYMIFAPRLKGQGPDMIAGMMGSVATGIMVGSRGRLAVLLPVPKDSQEFAATRRTRRRVLLLIVVLGLVFLIAYANAGYPDGD